MIINICGASGQGKSEVVSHLQEQGYQVETLLTHTNRPTTIEEFCNNQSHLICYRNKLIEEHKSSIESRDKILIIEASFFDMFIYSLLVVGLNTDFRQWIDEFFEQAREYQQDVDLIINLPLNPIEDTTLPYYTATSHEVLVKHYQKNYVEDHCKIVNIDVKSTGENREDYIEEICEKVDEVISEYTS